MNIFDFLILGIVGGLSPGPITALLLGETFKHGWKSGIKVPFAMLFSNLVVAPVSVGILFLGSQIDSFLELITYAGAAVLLIMGMQEWQSSGELKLKTSSKPFQKSLLLDFINPHPYIFWFTILAPQVVLQIRSGGLVQTNH
jgi:threonine/homoserine/homoserine lactone efflux protein